jgi:sulfate permease, SulP family
MTDDRDDAPVNLPSKRQRASDAYGPRRSAFRSKPKRPVLQRLVPVSQELPRYRGRALRQDVLAGFTVAAIALPAAMAYAELAGLSPVVGLYALLLPTVAYTLLGSSRQLIVGPEGSVSALVAAALLPIVAASQDPQRYASLAALLALLVGAVFLVARAVRLGWIADYFSRAVLTGYIHGVAIVLIVGQLGKLFGLSIDARGPIPQFLEFLRELSSMSVATLGVGVACLVALLVLRKVAQKLPGPLFVVVLAIGLSAAFEFANHSIATVGTIPSGLPGLALPSLRLKDILQLLPAALGIFFASYSDEVLTARSFAGKHGQHVRADQELVAMGLANAAAGISHGFPIGASGSRTAVNDQMGGRTQIAGLSGAAGIALVLLFFTEPMQYLPKATLGAVIVAAAIGLIDLASWRELARTNKFEVWIAAITMAGVIAVGVLEALIIDVVRRSAAPHDAVLGWVQRLGRYADVRLHPSARVTPGVLVYRLDDRLFFANAQYVRGRVHEAVDGSPTQVRWFVFDLEALTHIDATGAAALTELVEELRTEGITFAVARIKGPTQVSFAQIGLVQTIGQDRFFPTVRAAVDGAGTG